MSYLLRKANFSSGRYYHVFNHGIAWENLFKDKDNYAYFLRRFHQYLDPFVDLYGYCLLPNHFHLLIRVKDIEENECEVHRMVLQAFSNFQNSYSKSINKRHNRKGRLLQGSLNRKLVRDEVYLEMVAEYIYLNPVAHGFCSSPEDWPHLWIRPQLHAA